MQDDVLAIVDGSNNIVGSYTYDAWGKVLSATGGIAQINPIRYRSYYYDAETGLYYLNSRYYDSEIGRFVNADNQLATGDMTGMNLFAYCGNNPVTRTDSTGEVWWHWAIGAAIVVACAAATVITCGGFAAAAMAVGMVGSGVAAATTASTVAVAAFIGSATVYGMAALTAIADSRSVSQFNAQGNWGTVAATAGGAVIGGASGYLSSKSIAAPKPKNQKNTQRPFLPDDYYANRKAPKYSTPNSTYVNYKLNSYTGEYEKSTVCYDFAGRQVIRIDWTNHGYPNHGNPHVHYTIYDAQYRDGNTIRWD